MSPMLEGSRLNWFVDVKRLSPDQKVDPKRGVWLNYYGVPLNLWNAGIFVTLVKGGVTI